MSTTTDRRFHWGRKKDKKPVQQSDATSLVRHSPPTSSKGAEPQQQVITEKKQPGVKPKTSSSWFCRTLFFENLCDMAFGAIDVDGSNSVDQKELYSGLLLIHLKLGTYAGPAACRPLSRERCNRVFEQFDVDNSGSLDKKEFKQVMMVLFSNVFLRVIVQWTMTLMIVPFVARYILNGMVWTIGSISSFIANLDEHSSLANAIELFVEKMYALFASTTGLNKVTSVLGRYLEKIPDSVWEALPLGLISAVLGIAVVPYCIFQVDDFFQRVAERKSKKKN